MTYKLLVVIFQLIFMLKTNNKINRKIYKTEINKKSDTGLPVWKLLDGVELKMELFRSYPGSDVFNRLAGSI